MDQDLDIYLVRSGDKLQLMCEHTFKKIFGFSPSDNGFFHHNNVPVSVRYYNTLLDTTFQKGGTWDT